MKEENHKNKLENYNFVGYDEKKPYRQTNRLLKFFEKSILVYYLYKRAYLQDILIKPPYILTSSLLINHYRRHYLKKENRKN
jgi:hypothetical protein